LSARRLERFADPGARAAELRAAAGGTAPEDAGGRTIHYLGAGGGRDRIWIQCDAAGDGGAMTAAAATVLASLTSDDPNRYRPLLMGRARIAVVPPGPPAGTAGGPAGPRLFDGGALGASGALLRAMAAFTPNLVVHLQDFSGLGADGMDGMDGASGAEGLGWRLGGAGLRMVESFHLAPDLHRRLGAGGEGGEGRRTWLGRPSALARELAAHPDARVGGRVQRHVLVQGYRVFATGAEQMVQAEDPSWPAAIRLAPGRYVPRLEWRRLGAASLGEMALARFGALAVCGQTFPNPPAERAGAAVALAEAAVLHRLNLVTGLETGGAA
jgi:hypothetical protein